MASNMRTSRAGLDVIKASEGFRPRYEQLPDGRWIIGFGHVRSEREGLRVSDAEAEAILREYDLPPVERLVQDCVLAPLNQNEFDALVSLAFNIGAKAFASSDVVAHINSGNRLAAAGAFDHWRRAKIGGRIQIVDALVRRRAVEKALFLRAPGNMPVASSRIYRALHDKTGLPSPTKPREILVERRQTPSGFSAEAQSSKTDKEETVKTATEEAAESVRKQMVRILGEDGEKVSKPLTTDGASPEEITAAVSELAGETSVSAPRKSVWPQREDLPPPPMLEREITQRPRTNGKAAAPIAEIDDLEEIEITSEKIEHAVAENEALGAEARGGKIFDAMPYGLLSLIGAGLAGYGTATQFGYVEAVEASESSLATYLPPFLMLLGGLLFLVMAYYFFRTLFSDD
jgi:lysozyme